MSLVVLVTVAAGGGGAVLRYLVSLWFARSRDAGEPGTRFPWAVLVINAVGSALGGAVLALAEHGLSAEAQLVLLSGVCGGLTTFSTFSVETVQLATTRRWRFAALSVAANVIVGFVTCALSYQLFA